MSDGCGSFDSVGTACYIYDDGKGCDTDKRG